MSRKKDLAFWNIPVPRSLNEAVEIAVNSDGHVSKSEFVRDACRQLLEKMNKGDK